MDKLKSAASAVALVFVCAFTANSAFAGEAAGQVRMEDIGYQDLNLATTAGVDALYKRIHAAAQRVCSAPESPELGAASASAKCTKEAESRVIEEMNLPALTAIAADR